MKALLLLLTIILNMGCEISNPISVNSEIEKEIKNFENLVYVIQNKWASFMVFHISGILINTGNTIIPNNSSDPLWAMRTSIYSDSTLSLKLGIFKQTMKYSLNPGDTRYFHLTSTPVNEYVNSGGNYAEDYPNFTTSNLYFY